MKQITQFRGQIQRSDLFLPGKSDTLAFLGRGILADRRIEDTSKQCSDEVWKRLNVKLEMVPEQTKFLMKIEKYPFQSNENVTV